MTGPGCNGEKKPKRRKKCLSKTYLSQVIRPSPQFGRNISDYGEKSRKNKRGHDGRGKQGEIRGLLGVGLMSGNKSAGDGTGKNLRK